MTNLVTLSPHGRYLRVTYPESEPHIEDSLKKSQRLRFKPGRGGWVTEVKDVMGLVTELKALGLQVKYGPPVLPAPKAMPDAPVRPRGIVFRPSDLGAPHFAASFVAKWRSPTQDLPTLEPVDLANLDTDFETPGFRGELYPFQRQGVAFLRQLGYSGIIADEMGLGKTIMGIVAAMLNGERTLVVAPASVKYNWAAEIERFSDKTVRIFDGGGTRGPADAFFTIVNYDILPRLAERLNAEGFGLVILDEAHYAKNPHARRSQAVYALQIPKRILLTGTPLMNRPEELYPLLNFVQPGKWGTSRDFDYLYVRRITKLANDRLRVSGAAGEHLADLRERLRAIMIRRQKETVLTDLPAKVIEVQPLELPEEARKTYDMMQKELVAELREMGIEVAFRGHGWMRTMAKMHALKQFTIAQRIGRAKEWLEDQAKQGEKVVVFSQYLAPLHELARAFGTRCVLIDGSVPSEERLARADLFNSTPQIDFCIGQIQAMGVGLNLTAARRVLFLDLAWTPAAHSQAMDRCHRIGQKREVIVTFLMTPGTIDEHLQRVLLSKQAVINTVMGERQEVIREPEILKRVAEELIAAAGPA
ncbi:MAG: DEAD/DEAH box helicase [Thermoplasmatota archaeon]